MSNAIQYTKSSVSTRPTYRTEKFSNLLSDTYQAQVEQSTDDTWQSWFFNWSRKESDFKLGLKSKLAAIRWANARLREVGVR